MRRLGLAALATCAAISSAQAQVSIFSVRGIGFPGWQYGPRAQAMGGGLAPLDPLSAVNPASISDLTVVTVQASSGTSFRDYTFSGSASSGLHDTRFPFAIAGGPIPGTPFTMSISYGAYLDRTYDLSATDTVLLRGNPIGVSDRIASDGGVADVRGALAWTDKSRHLSLGVAGHLFSGSAKLVASRSFSDSAYRTYNEQGEEQMGAAGMSAGFLLRIGKVLHLAGSARVENELAITIDSVELAHVHLPMAMTGGFLVQPGAGLKWAASATWQNWTKASADSTVVGGSTFDTWTVGTGVELGPEGSLPIRLGARYSQLPFSPTTEQPHEWGFSFGTGKTFARSKGQLDATLIRVIRDGAGVAERVWQLAFSLTVRP